MHELSENEYQEKVSSGTVLLDFSAEWCGPCKAMLPVLRKLADEYGTKINVYSVDIDKEPGIAAKNGVMSVPTFVLFHQGQPVDRLVGAVPERELRKRIDSWVG